MPRLELFPFRFRDPVSGKWVKARYVAERHEIEARHARGEWEIIGRPEIREVDDQWSYFSPWTNHTPIEERPVDEPKQMGSHCEHEPQLDERERFLVLLSFVATSRTARDAPAMHR